MDKEKQKKKVLNPRAVDKELRSIEGGLRGLADNLEHHLSRRREKTERRNRGLSAFDQRVHEYKIEAGKLLDKAVELGGFQEHGSLRRLVGSQRFKLYPDSGHRSAFEYTCLKWIPKQPDGFDFEWKRKQVGEVRAYIAAMRYLADCLAKTLTHEAE
jgi:hypothetical protein